MLAVADSHTSAWTSHEIVKQEAFEKCWAHSPLRAAARRLFYIAIHQVSLLSHAACASMSTTTTTCDTGDRYGPTEWAQQLWMWENCNSQTMMWVQVWLQSSLLSQAELHKHMVAELVTRMLHFFGLVNSWTQLTSYNCANIKNLKYGRQSNNSRTKQTDIRTSCFSTVLN